MSLIFVSLLFFTEPSITNQPPIVPNSIITQLFGDTTKVIEFTVQTTDPDNDKISYQFDWGDGIISEWSEFSLSGYVFTSRHIYKNLGEFQCRARTSDERNNISNWSEPFIITIVPMLLKWIYSPILGIYSGVAIGPSKEIYVTSENGEVHSLNRDGSLRWMLSTLSPIYSSPIVGKNVIYVTTTGNKLYAIDFSGKELWKFETDSPIYSTPTLLSNNIICFGCDDGNIYAISSSGKLLWKYKTGDEISGSPSVSIDGTIFIASDAVYAITAKGKSKWIYRPSEEDETYFSATPAIDVDGTIYIGGTDGALYAINKQGRLKWRAMTPDEDAIRAGVSIDQKGIIYFGAENGILYKKELYGEVIPVFESDYYIFSTPAIDSLGNIYFVSDDGFFYCLRQDGKLLFKWQIAEDSKEMIYSSSPIIADDGTVYVGSWDGSLYAFSGFAPPAKSAWPFYRYNQQNTGRKQK